MRSPAPAGPRRHYTTKGRPAPRRQSLRQRFFRERIELHLTDPARNQDSTYEYEEGLSADIVAREYDDTDYTRRLAVVAASITFNRDDLEKAARRAAIISRVAGVPTTAFLATHYECPPEVDEIARQLDINIIRYESEEHRYEYSPPLL